MSLYEGNSGDTHIYLIFHAQFSLFLAHCMLKGYLCKVFKSFRAGGLSDVFCWGLSDVCILFQSTTNVPPCVKNGFWEAE